MRFSGEYSPFCGHPYGLAGVIWLSAEPGSPPEAAFFVVHQHWPEASYFWFYHSLSGRTYICWASKKQPVTSLSSTEAEYYAASACGTAVLALRLFMRDIGAAQLLPTPVYVDNTACVHLAKNLKACKRTKPRGVRRQNGDSGESNPATRGVRRVHAATARGVCGGCARPQRAVCAAANRGQRAAAKHTRGQRGIEPRTSCTQSKNHATRPLSRSILLRPVLC